MTDESGFSEIERRLVSTKNGRLRMDAGLVYMTDPDCGSIEQLSTDDRFQSVTKRTLERWCKEDRWVERRQHFLDRWSEHAKERLGSALSRHRTEEFQQLIQVRNLALDKLEDPLLEPKSWEGVAKALIDINRRIENVALSVGNEVLPEGIGAGSDAATGHLSLEEKQTVRKQLLASRRMEVRAQREDEHGPTHDESDDAETVDD